jgi:hypothetical protein
MGTGNTKSKKSISFLILKSTLRLDNRQSLKQENILKSLKLVCVRMILD